MYRFVLVVAVLFANQFLSQPVAAVGAGQSDLSQLCQSAEAPENGRVVCADLVALEQTLVYNRFGSFNPYGMIFALRRDVVSAHAGAENLDSEHCGNLLGTETGNEELFAGVVRLKDCKRPRPVTLRVNVGDRLLVRVGNLLTQTEPPDFSRDVCRDRSPSDEGRRRVRVGVREGDSLLVEHGEADCLKATEAETPEAPMAASHAPDWPRTRLLNFVVQGLHSLPDPETGAVHPACRGLDAVAPDETFLCLYSVDQEGTYFFASLAAPAGGEGDGGSIVHGLFGAIIAERQGSRWYRSQVTEGAMDFVWKRTATETDNRHARSGQINYEKTNSGVPVLNMARAIGVSQENFDTTDHLELVHTDLNAIIWCNNSLPDARQNCRESTDTAVPTTEPASPAFREFSVFFHDELKTFYTRNFDELDRLGQLAGVKDGFAINYGASGMGSLLLANRKGIGPAADCMECLYEEFFLASWANGDPALLEWYADDPSNVHHSYLNDPVVFRNFHAGPKETHVFHLHAHQWFAGNDPNRGSYLDSQTVAPQQGFTYNIYHGGLRGLNGDGKGWWDTQGSGNRNRTIGDSIFHCHLYPHFAQGMWALWRVHDVFEDGTRKLPDGQADAGLSIDFAPRDDSGVAFKRMGSVDRESGAWRDEGGTPIPAVVPLPGEALPLLPTYADTDEGEDVAGVPMPGYPFYIAGQPGHRPPQAPLDIARNLGANPGATVEGGKDMRDPVEDEGEEWLAAGLNRHVVTDGSQRLLGVSVPDTLDDGTAVADLTGEKKSLFYKQAVAKAFALGDLSGHLETAKIEALNPSGTLLERSAMGFHYNGSLYELESASSLPLKLEAVDGSAVNGQSALGSYTSVRAPTPAGVSAAPASFHVNGSAPKPGAPFSDPCGAARPENQGDVAGGDPLGHGWLDEQNFFSDPNLDGYRRYEVSAVQLDMVVNSAGWHDPQARINVLTAESDQYKLGPDWRISPRISDSEEPFFFRALSGECIEFRHTNELPKELELDDFQVKTPTDTIGQHIHLVKFDVTSSDGSGNGWNYEDGTFAPDEVAGRLCAWSKAGSAEADMIIDDLSDKIQHALNDEERTTFLASGGLCEWDVYKAHNIWRLERERFPFLFQTTTQRWFADPILSTDRDGSVDRTMRTVFTHDHFGPSSIQQHGFYSALVIEPAARLGTLIFPPGDGPVGRPLSESERLNNVAWGGKAWEGSRKRIITALNREDSESDPEYFQHPNYREFMLAIADFALLYDPRDREKPLLDEVAAQSTEVAGGLEGMARLHCEAYWRLFPSLLASVCGAAPERKTGHTSFYFPGELPPAFLAAGAYRDDVHRENYAGDLFDGPLLTADVPEVQKLGKHLVEFRQKAAGKWNPNGGDNSNAEMAKPVAAPARPEAISVDHHDPYLVSYRGSPIPLRIGTKEADGSRSNDCELKQMNRPGDNNLDISSEVVSALEDGSFGQCSVAHQRADEAGGDMGEAFSSRRHGDPDTPILEAYQGERLVMRLIQGAQEVQHTFNIAGQPFKRNIDQHWMQGMQPLGISEQWELNPTLQSDCVNRDVIRNSDSRNYRRWRDTAPTRWSLGSEPLDETFWLDYEKALVECDNIEGFTFAQEVGISEHFEMQGSLRADVNASAELAPPIPASSLDGDEVEVWSDDKVPLGSSDYLYSFGSVDALWNGAWGLVRVFADDDAYDPATLDFTAEELPISEASVKIGDRIKTIPNFRTTPEATDGLKLVGSQSGLACPIPSDGKPQRVVDAVVAAVEMRRVFTDQKGTLHGADLYDPDGLFLALLSPGDLGLAGIEDPGFGVLDTETVLSAITTAYPAQPEPFVLRITAGDCLRLRIVNLLGSEDGAGDALGDAILPKIVPLNADPVPAITEMPVAPNSDLHQVVGLLERPEGLASGIRPSTKLALSFGLPGLDLIRETPQGFGYNADALAGGNGGVQVSEILVTYAGRFRMDLPANVDAMLEELQLISASKLYDRLVSYDNAWAEGSLLHLIVENAGDDVPIDNVFKVLRPDNAEGKTLAKILGHPVTLQLWDGTELPFDGEVMVEGCPEPGCIDDTDVLNSTLSELLSVAINEALNERTHWIPYAFGAVPVRPLADPVSQVPHGLFGAIDVVPVNWEAKSDSGLNCDLVNAAGYVHCSARYVAPQGDGQPFVWHAQDENGHKVTLREFVLFWRDGMNLWDDRNAPPWQWADGEQNAGSLGKMVPDCIVCDDSYDRGEVAVSHNAESFSRTLVDRVPASELGSDGAIYRSDDLNAHKFPADYLIAANKRLELKAKPGEQIVIRVVHPGGRARQRAFAMNGYSYDDLFPGFGFPRSALLAPGKSITAWLRPDAEPGTTVWHDGPTHLRSAGASGLLKIEESD